MSQRRQYSSCDPCRRSKRRCSLPSYSDGGTCTNCQRLGHVCTFEFSKSRRTVRRNPSRQNQTLSRLSGSGHDLPEITADGLSEYYPSPLNGSAETPISWLNFDESHQIESTWDNTQGLDLTDLLAADVVTPAQPPSDARSSPLLRVPCTTPILPGRALNSPIRLLNSKLDATILDSRLARIHNTIITGCASRFADYDCNLCATGLRYRLEGADGGQSQGCAFPLNSAMASTDVTCTFTAIGAVRFLDHFGDLYGNRLSSDARRQSDAALRAVLRAFSLQWLSTSEGTPATDSIRDASQNAFYDSWFAAREILGNAQAVRSFRVVYAILLFDGISVPTQASAGPPHELLNAGLQTLCSLDALIGRYCATLGAHSTYSMLLEASMAVVRWGGYIRDIGASLTTDRRCKLPVISGHGKGLFTTESTFDRPGEPGFPSDLDGSISGTCRTAAAEAFSICRSIVDVKNFESTDSVSLRAETIAATVEVVGNFNRQFRPFVDECVERLEILSIHSKAALVSLLLFWDLSVLILGESLEPAVEDGDHDYGSTILKVRTCCEEAVSSVTRTVERVLSLPTDETFNRENGLSAEVPLLAYHITPRLTAAVFQKTIDRLISSRNGEGCAENPHPMDPTADPVFRRQIDALLKGLTSLSVTVGGSEAAAAVFQDLMPRNGDIISECWTSDFST